MTTQTQPLGSVVFAGASDDVVGKIVSIETHDPDGNELAESVIWVQWPDMEDLDLLTWDDVIQVG